MSSNPPNEAPSKPASSWKKVLAIASACGVLGVLVLCAGAIATPKYMGIGCRGKQSEAKTNLMGLYTAERVFEGEYGTHSTDLVSLNWMPDGSPVYAYGFTTPSESDLGGQIPDYDPTRLNTVDERVQAKGRFRSEKMKTYGNRVYTKADFASFAATATSAGFLAYAVGDIDSDFSDDLDIWSIDEKRELRVVRNDCVE